MKLTIWNKGVRYTSLVLFGVALLIGPNPSIAQSDEATPTFGGDFCTRSRLTGNWGGLRDDLGKKGVFFDTDMLLMPQSVLKGGKGTGTEFWGNVTYTLNLDTGKMGLWPGGFFKFSGISSFGNTLSGEVGSIAPANATWIFPSVFKPDTALMNATFTQFLSPKFGIFIGKINTLDLVHSEFYGDYRSQFMNTALCAPMAGTMVPLSAYGAGALFMPSENVTLSVMALDPSGTPTDNSLSEVFSDGVTFVAGANVKIKPWGLVGHQSVTGIWSNKERTSLDQDPSNLARMLLFEKFPRLGNPGPILQHILERRFPGLLVPVKPLNHEDNTWAIIYGFDQYFWQPDGDANRGMGVFFNFGFTDADPNPIKYSYMMGIGGKGVFSGRPHDTFGVGWARTEFSDDFIPFLRDRLNLGLDYEDSIEMYYNFSIAPWMTVSPNLQIINPGLKKTLCSNGTLKDVDTVVVAGVRTYIRF